MSNKNLDRVIKKLYFSPTLREDLRQNPTAVASRFKLNTRELAAVQSGNAATLVAAGMNPKLVTDATPTVVDKMSLQLRRVFAVGLAAVGMLVFVPLAYAGERVAPRIGRRVSHRAGPRMSPRFVLGRVRARISARAGEVQARHALRRVRDRMLERGDGNELEPQLQTDPALSVEDPIQ